MVGIIVTLMATSIALMMLEVVGFIGFLLIALRLFILSRLLKSESLEYATISFLLLSFSQLSMAFSAIIAAPNISTALYVASGGFAALGFYPLTEKYKGRGGEWNEYALFPLLSLYKLLIAVPDLAAGFFGFKTSKSVESKTNAIMVGIAFTFLLRGLIIASAIFNPPLSIVDSGLIVVELVRSSLIIALLIKYIVEAGGL